MKCPFCKKEIPKRVTGRPKQIDDIQLMALRNGGLSMRKIAKVMGASLGSVRYAIKRLGLVLVVAAVLNGCRVPQDIADPTVSVDTTTPNGPAPSPTPTQTPIVCSGTQKAVTGYSSQQTAGVPDFCIDANDSGPATLADAGISCVNNGEMLCDIYELSVIHEALGPDYLDHEVLWSSTRHSQLNSHDDLLPANEAWVYGQYGNQGISMIQQTGVVLHYFCCSR